MPLLLWGIVNWLLRSVVVQFVVMGAVMVVVTQLMPLVFSYVAPFVGVNSLNASLAGLPAGVWFFLDFLALDVGLPLILSAAVTRFLIRRIPFIG